MNTMDEREDFQSRFEPMVIIDDEENDEAENINFKTDCEIPLSNENQPLSIGPEVTIFPVKRKKPKAQFKIRLFQKENSPNYSGGDSGNDDGNSSSGDEGDDEKSLMRGARLPVRRVSKEEALNGTDTYARRKSSPLEKCPICKKFFRRMKTHLLKHEILQKEEILARLTCTFCAKVFNNHANLQIHMRTHTGDKPYVCEVCDKSFSQSCNLVNHMRIHTGEKPFKCPHCDRAFTQSGNLNNHIRLHTDEKPFKCHYCDKAFVQSGNLNSHIRNNHKIDVDDGYSMISIKG